MAEEPKEVNAGLEKIFMNRIVKQIKESNEENTLTLAEKIETAMEGISNLNVADSNKLTMATKTQGSMVKESIDEFINESGIANLTKNIDILESDISEMKSTLEKNGQDTNISAIKELEEQKKQLEEIRQYGRVLGNFERGFVKFAGGTFEDMKKSIEEGGDRTAAGIAKGFGNDLRGDFDKLLSFFGPAAGILQQIPLLGTIFNVIKETSLSILTRLALGLKRQLFFEGKEDAREARSVKVDTANYRLNFLREKRDEIRFRQEQKDRLARKSGVGTALGAGDVTNKEDESNFKLGVLIPFLTLAKMFGVGIGKGLSAIGGGFALLGRGLAKASKGIAIGGLALGVGLSGIFGAFALGDKIGAFDGMQEFNKINMGRLLFGLGGLSAIILAIGGLAILAGPAMGFAAVGLALVMGSMVAMGASLGMFADSIKPFESMDTLAIMANIRDLASVSSEIGTLLKTSAGSFFGNLGVAITGHPLAMLSEALKGYDDDMTQSIGNLNKLKGALANFEIPQTTAGQAIADFFGVGGVDQIENLAQIKVNEGIGDEISKLGEGVELIANALGGLDSAKVKLLGELKDNLRGMNSINLNFNASGQMNDISPSPTGANMNQQPIVLQQMSSPVQNIQNVRQNYTASGSNMGKHSSLHYPSLG